MDSRCKITKKHLFITCNYFEMQSYTRFFNAEIPKSGYFSIFPFPTHNYQSTPTQLTNFYFFLKKCRFFIQLSQTIHTIYQDAMTKIAQYV